MLAMASSSLAFVQPTLPAQVSDEEYLAYKAIVTLYGSIYVISCILVLYFSNKHTEYLSMNIKNLHYNSAQPVPGH